MRKITGAYKNLLGVVEFHEQELPLKNPGAFMPAVMVIGGHSNDAPKVFTESEVKAMLERYAIAVEGRTGVWVPPVVVSLDPA